MTNWIHPHKIRQKGIVDSGFPGNWFCTNEDCVYVGFVVSFCGHQPSCPHCGEPLTWGPASYWALEKRVGRLEHQAQAMPDALPRDDFRKLAQELTEALVVCRNAETCSNTDENDGVCQPDVQCPAWCKEDIDRADTALDKARAAGLEV